MESKDEIHEKVCAMLAVSPALYLSTSAENMPWVAGAYFAETDAFTLTVVLEGEGRTLHNLRANPYFSIVISNGSPFEMFLQADGGVVVSDDDAELAQAKQAIKAKVPQAASLLDAPIPVVAVQLRVREWRATDIVNGWLPGRRLSAPAWEPLA
jgi:hypothetical protein